MEVVIEAPSARKRFPPVGRLSVHYTAGKRIPPVGRLSVRYTVVSLMGAVMLHPEGESVGL